MRISLFKPGCLILGAWLSSLAALSQDPANWGMSKLEVKQVEKKKFLKDTITAEGDGFLGYEGKVMSLDGHTFYIFKEGKLASTEDFFQLAEAECLEKLSEVAQLLNQRFGAARQSSETWKDEQYKILAEQKAKAICHGYLKLYSQWESGNTVVSLNMYGDAEAAWLAVDYLDKNSIRSSR